MARTASRWTSTDLDRSTNLRCCSRPVSIIGPWFSSDSAKFASTPQLWWAISTSSEWANLMSTSMPLWRTMLILFASLKLKLRNAAASSRCTSMESLSASASSGCRPFISTNWKRHLGVRLSWRTARHAWRCVSWSLSRSKVTNGRSTPMRSSTRWFFSFDATLFSAKDTQRRVSRSSDVASGMSAATAPESKSSWWFVVTMARFPMPSAPKRRATVSSPRAKLTIWGMDPARWSAAWESRFAAKRARARATSRRTSGSGDSAKSSRYRRLPSSIRRRCVRPSTISARFARQAQACVSRTTSRLCISAMSAPMTPDRAMVTLFSSASARLQSAAATSRWTSTDSDWTAKINGSSAPSRTSWSRIVWCVPRPRIAAMAWNWTSVDPASVEGKA
mmetsp:Transcript_18733/g.65025  ORF Transcript_18733/g.65025 Transcript_18733/m.65025 type:complete len:392 (+) Transcript_18733:1746-2921(+)